MLLIQRNAVNQLKSDMESLQEDIKAQLVSMCFEITCCFHSSLSVGFSMLNQLTEIYVMHSYFGLFILSYVLYIDIGTVLPFCSIVYFSYVLCVFVMKEDCQN